MRIAEAAGDLGDDGRIERQRAVLDALPLRLDLLGKGLGAEIVHQDLDARLPDVVAPGELVVGAQHRLDVAQHVALLQERLDRLGEERRAAEAAADHDLEAGLAGAVAVQPQRQVVDAQSGAIVARRAHRDLELARQEGKFRMQRHVLADELGPDARILDLVGRDAGPLVGGDVAHAIAAGLHAVHADAGEIGHRVGQFLELDPVELDVLPRGEMPVAAIVTAGDMREHAQLLRRQRAVGDGGAQHVGVELQIDAIHQAQRLELVLGQLARQAARDLVAEIRDALGNERAVEIVIEIHARPGFFLRATMVSTLDRLRQLDGGPVAANALAQVSRAARRRRR